MLHTMANADPRNEESPFAHIAELAEMFTALVQIIHSGEAVRFTPARIVELAALCMPPSKGAS